MHVVHLTASAQYGGPERQMIGLARALRGTHATSLLSFAEGGRCGAFLTAARSSGVPGVALRHDTPRLFAAIGEIAEFLSDAHADVLCCHGYKANLLGRAAARRCGLPVLAVSRGWTGENLKVRLYENLDRLHLRRLDRVVCVSEAQANKAQATGVPRQQIRVIANAVDPTRFSDPDPACRLQLLGMFPVRPARLVGAAGRLSPEKGFATLVAAATRVLATEPTTGFILFGEGPCRRQLEQQIEAAGLTGRFLLAGFRDDLDRFFPILDVFVLPSFTEGMPNVVLEALAAGAPVVATAVGGTPEIVQDGQTGFLVPPADIEALAATMARVLALPDGARALKWSARKRVQQQFTFAAQARQYCDLFAEVVGRGREAGSLVSTGSALGRREAPTKKVA